MRRGHFVGGGSNYPTDSIYFQLDDYSPNEYTIAFNGASGGSPTLFYSYDYSNWSMWYWDRGVTLELTYDKPKVYIRGEGNFFAFGASGSSACFTFQNIEGGSGSGNYVYCGGYIDALINSTPTATYENYQFANLFKGCKVLNTYPSFGTTNISQYCYLNMFWGCSGINFSEGSYYSTNLSSLPATTLKYGCYKGMFYNCGSLQEAPEIKAVTLDKNCCQEMFYLCTLLSTAPDLNAPTLVSYCYADMFNQCRNLNKVKCTATSGINQNSSTSGWLTSVSASGTFIKASSATWPTGVDGIPSGWTVSS